MREMCYIYIDIYFGIYGAKAKMDIAMSIIEICKNNVMQFEIAQQYLINNAIHSAVWRDIVLVQR